MTRVVQAQREAPHRHPDLPFGLGVQCGGGFVEDHDPGVPQQDARYGETLALSPLSRLPRSPMIVS